MASAEESSIIAAIIGVAGAGFRLSLILNAVSCEAASEGLEVHSISKTVTLFSLALKQIGLSLQSADSVHTWEALDGVQQISEDATRVFDEFNDMLERVRTKPADGSPAPPIQQRFQWCFKRHRVTYLLGQLESHKLSLSVIQQILQLGKLMASTSKNDPQDEVALKQELIRNERAETQNVLIVRYWQMSKMDRLFEASRLEDEDDKVAAIEHHDDDLTLVNSAGSSQLALEAPPAPPAEYASSMALIKLPSYSLGELDHTLHKIKQSPKDMVQVSNDAIEPLLDRWTRWYQVRERRHARDSGSGRYVPHVDNLYEDDDDRPYYQKYRERGDSPKGYYLEGTTTDWRKPHSVEAMEEARRRRQKYTKYQASVSAHSSDVDDSPGSTNSRKKKSPRHHIIDSASESSDSEHDQPRVRIRRGSASPTTERKMVFPESSPLAHSYTAGVNVPRKSPMQAQPAMVNIGSRLAPAAPAPSQRPHATPDQRSMHHSLSYPFPPIHTANAPNPYQQPNAAYHQYPPQYPPQPSHSQQVPYPSAAQARYMPPQQPAMNRMGVPPVRPGSRDGPGGRSPSRAVYPPIAPTRQHSKPDGKVTGKEAKKNLREGATKGLLGAGAIAGFLEALEGLSI